MAVDVTSALELRYGLAPTWWIWRAGRDIAWNRAASEEPDVNVSTCPFNRVYATADVVEAGTISWFWILQPALLLWPGAST